MNRFAFFLGGRDLEMEEIGRLIRRHAPTAELNDRRLCWGEAAASAYGHEIDRALRAGWRPVLVELRPDLPAGIIDQCLIIDHHGARAGADQPTSLEQVFALLGLAEWEWTRRLRLVAANDRGWIPELRAVGALPEEIEAIRREDRSAQGVTADQERAGEEALGQRWLAMGGELVVVRMPHDRVAVVMDRLALEARDPPDVLVLSPHQVNFSGRGQRVQALVQAFPGGWHGGALPARGFWGHSEPLPSLDEILSALS